MGTHRVGTREEWVAARKVLLQHEKEHTRRSDELARRRRELPWVPVEKPYAFDTDEGRKSLAELFDGRSQLLVYHFMFGPNYAKGCPSCSAIADGFNGFVWHLAQRDVTMLCISRAPLAKLQAYKQHTGWTFPWVSSSGSDFNFDFDAAYTLEQLREGDEYNFQPFNSRALLEAEEGGEAESAASSGTVVAEYLQEAPGMSAFALADGTVYHTYSAYARGLDGLWGAYQWLDRTPLGREAFDRSGIWPRRGDR